MTATFATIGYGTLFQYGDNASPINWAGFAEVKAVTLPPLTRDVVDAGHESAPDEWREVLTGLKNAGEVSVECNFHKTTFITLLNELDTTVVKPRRIVFPDGSMLFFDGYLTSIEAGVTTGELISASAKFRATGAPSFIAA